MLTEKNTITVLDKQKFFLSLLISASVLFFPFCRSGAATASYYPTDAIFYLVPVAIVVLLNICLLILENKLIHNWRLYFNISYILLLIIPFVGFRAKNHSILNDFNIKGSKWLDLFLSHSRFNTDVGYYLFVFSIIWNLYYINKGFWEKK